LVMYTVDCLCNVRFTIVGRNNNRDIRPGV
jgi:hypothetical protein